MAAPRAIHFLALRNFSCSSRQIRQRYLNRPATSAAPTSLATRHFTTTLPIWASGDNSTIDFAYLPSGDMEPTPDDFLRVPILPNNYDTATNAPPEEDLAVMKPEINSMSADAVFLPMADMSDGHSMNIDFHAMADRVAASFKQKKDVPAEEQAGMMKQIWSDLVDDMIGSRKKGGS